MTEKEWLGATDPQVVLEFLRGKASERKLRLFSAACSRRLWKRLSDSRSHSAVELAELYADGEITAKRLRSTERAAYYPAWGRRGRQLPAHAAYLLAAAEPRLYQLDRFIAPEGGDRVDHVAWAREITWTVVRVRGGKAEAAHHCALLRDIFANPFRQVSVEFAWRTVSVLALAQAAYDQRILPAGTVDSDHLAVLADALEDAGCTDAAILEHLRGPGPLAFRGCWGLDLLLDKK